MTRLEAALNLIRLDDIARTVGANYRPVPRHYLIARAEANAAYTRATRLANRKGNTRHVLY